MNDSFYNEILIDHNLHPVHLHELPCATCSNDGVNPACGDSLTLNLSIKDGIITDGSYIGVGCAVSQASTDIMLDLVIGKTPAEARRLKDLFSKMINGQISPDDLETLDEAGALRNISRMPARVKCAMLGWRTLGDLLDKEGV